MMIPNDSLPPEDGDSKSDEDVLDEVQDIGIESPNWDERQTEPAQRTLVGPQPDYALQRLVDQQAQLSTKRSRTIAFDLLRVTRDQSDRPVTRLDVGTQDFLFSVARLDVSFPADRDLYSEVTEAIDSDRKWFGGQSAEVTISSFAALIYNQADQPSLDLNVPEPEIEKDDFGW